MVGVPVIINHKDLNKKNVDDERVGVVNSVYLKSLSSLISKYPYRKLNKGISLQIYLSYLSRISMLWMGYSEKLTKAQKLDVSERYDRIRSQIIENKGFGSKEVLVRCYGKYLWLAYITPGRIYKRVKRKL